MCAGASVSSAGESEMTGARAGKCDGCSGAFDDFGFGRHGRRRDFSARLDLDDDARAKREELHGRFMDQLSKLYAGALKSVGVDYDRLSDCYAVACREELTTLR